MDMMADTVVKDNKAKELEEEKKLLQRVQLKEKADLDRENREKLKQKKQ